MFEARKATSAPWDRLLEAKHPAHRIAHAPEGSVTVGALLECASACAAADQHCSSLGISQSMLAGAWSKLVGTGKDKAATQEELAAAAACQERCRVQCAAEFSSRLAVR